MHCAFQAVIQHETLGHRYMKYKGTGSKWQEVIPTTVLCKENLHCTSFVHKSK